MGSRHRYRFVVEQAYTPETLPMARLAEYMAKMAALLGERSDVHFVRIEEGSAVLLQDVEHEAQPVVRERIHAVGQGAGPPDLMQAYEALNVLLVDDGTSGYLTEDGTADAPGARLLEFPGAAQDRAPVYGPFTEVSELQGVVIRLGGELTEVPVHLRDRDVVHICHAKRDLARDLARHIFGQPLRVVGKGRWNRTVRGRWSMLRFLISDFTELKADPLSSVVSDLQRVASATPVSPDALETLRTLRRSED